LTILDRHFAILDKLLAGIADISHSSSKHMKAIIEQFNNRVEENEAGSITKASEKYDFAHLFS
jgi:DNA-directed RNA polymerase subunit F